MQGDLPLSKPRAWSAFIHWAFGGVLSALSPATKWAEDAAMSPVTAVVFAGSRTLSIMCTIELHARTSGTMIAAWLEALHVQHKLRAADRNLGRVRLEL